jgi:3'(2'), 5'-bisphosphate nucleotidase
MDAIVEQMIEIAAEAAVEIMDVYQRPFSVDYKTPRDPVTEADRRANALICDRLRGLFPEIPIVAEESPPEEWASYRESSQVFFVDPVDGTREFVAKNGNFVVMIGLLTDDQPSHGVIFSPVRGTCWAGQIGHGAERREKDGTVTQLHPLQDVPLSRARVLASRSQHTALNRETLEVLSPGEVLKLGSAGLKGAALADGQADIYLTPGFAGSLWDSCAPEAIVRSLGGVFSDAFGLRLDYRAAGVENNRGAVAASPRLHAEVIERISGLLR